MARRCRGVASGGVAAAQAEFKAQLTQIKREMDEKMKAAKSEAERIKIRADAEAKAREADVEHRNGATTTGKSRNNRKIGDGPTPGTKAPKYKDPGKRDINDDILNGL